MDNEKKEIIFCPICNCRYQVPLKFNKKKVHCKQCGREFTITFPSSPAHDSSLPEDPAKVDDLIEISVDDPLLILGQLAVKFGFINQGQLQQIIGEYCRSKETGDESQTGRLLVERGLISENQLSFILAVQGFKVTRETDCKFGHLAIKNNFASPKDVEWALKEQKRIFSETKAIALIGDILVQKGIITPVQREAILLVQKRLKASGEEAEEEEKPEEQPPFESEYDITVSEGNAYIFPKVDEPGKTTLEDIKNLLAAKRVVFGLVDDQAIAGYLQDRLSQKQPWLIAESKPPDLGRKAEILYHFETDPFKTGVVRAGGTIDFKDRGAIPQVQAGDLIAEVIPGEPGTPGTNVFGQPIPCP